MSEYYEQFSKEELVCKIRKQQCTILELRNQIRFYKNAWKESDEFWNAFMKRLMQTQKNNGKTFMSDTDIEDLIDKIQKEENINF